MHKYEGKWKDTFYTFIVLQNFMSYDMVAPIKIHNFIIDYFLTGTLKTSMIVKPFFQILEALSSHQ